ncbi:MAG TPA: hypothetical protein VFJ92_08110 [Gemmatimonadales bacterium]|jgi:hypothetical protein|nr:hypothetical protein [Gemmatimonadales bacterium]
MRKSHGPIVVALLLAVACAPTTEVTNSWKDPSAGSVRFTKVLAVCACKDAGTRRTVEDVLAKRIKNSTPSYQFLTDDDLHDREAAKAKVKAGGFDGAVIMALVNVDRTTTYVPGQAYAVPSYYNTMWGGWGYGWSTYYDPGYVQENQYVDFNTNVYQIEQEKLLWSSRSQTVNPTNMASLVDEIVTATVNEMKKQKVFAN